MRNSHQEIHRDCLEECQKIDTIHNQYSLHNYIVSHTDSLLSARVYYDQESNVWIVEYYCDQVLTSCALYQSKPTALLVLHSHGYDQTEELIS